MREAAPRADIAWPNHVPLSRAPTPLERIDERAPIAGWIKRDDLTGIAESGNKVRKLEFLMAEAQAHGARAVLTCGGVNSNHARATAVAARRLGLDVHLLLRGTDRRPPMGNLLLDRILGAEVRFIPREAWPNRDALMAEWAESIPNAYVIPQGGSNAVGALGYVRAAEEIVQQTAEAGLGIDTVVHAAGSGGTTAGLALGFAACDNPVRLIAVKVDEDPGMDAHIARILDEAVERGFVSTAIRASARYELVEGWGDGYARTRPEEIATCAAFARATGIFVDPVYTGKAAHWLAARKDGKLGRSVFVHTGGIFELFAYAAAFEPHPA